MIQSIFHVNINVSDFERSLAFYKMLGFRVVNDLGTGSSPQLDAGLQIPNGQARAALLMLGDNPHATRIDLIEWKQPKTDGTPYPHLAPCRHRPDCPENEKPDAGVRRPQSQGGHISLAAAGDHPWWWDDPFCVLPRS